MKTNTVINTVEEVFNELPKIYSVRTLISKTKRKTARFHRYPTDGTITRQLRRLRDRKVISYEIEDRNKAIYRKL